MLCLGVFLQSLDTKFAPHAALFISPERSLLAAEMPLVDPYGSRSQPAGNAQGAVLVLRPHAAAKAVNGIVGKGDRLLFCFGFNNGENRAEDLLSGNRHGVLDRREDGRLDKKAFGEAGIGGRAPSRCQRGSLLFSLFNVLKNSLALTV